jgi:hypothetical protein
VKRARYTVQSEFYSYLHLWEGLTGVQLVIILRLCFMSNTLTTHLAAGSPNAMKMISASVNKF